MREEGEGSSVSKLGHEGGQEVQVRKLPASSMVQSILVRQPMVAMALVLCNPLVGHSNPLCTPWADTRNPWNTTRKMIYRHDLGPDPLVPALEAVPSIPWFNRGDMSRLDVFLKKLAAVPPLPSNSSATTHGRDPIYVVAMGGSMTMGHELCGNRDRRESCAWPSLLVNWLKKAYPNAAPLITLKIMAQGAMDSNLGGRLQLKALYESKFKKHIGIVFVDFNVNDSCMVSMDEKLVGSTAKIVAGIHGIHENAESPALVYIETAMLGGNNDHEICDMFDGAHMAKGACSRNYVSSHE